MHSAWRNAILALAIAVPALSAAQAPDPSAKIVTSERADREQFLAQGAKVEGEVVVYTPDHAGSLAGASLLHLRRLIAVWAHRSQVLGARPEVEYVYVFENRGEAIGVTLHHPHGQIYAYPFIPPIPALAPNAMCTLPRIFSSSSTLPVSVAFSLVPMPSSARFVPDAPCASSLSRNFGPSPFTAAVMWPFSTVRVAGSLQSW